MRNILVVLSVCLSVLTWSQTYSSSPFSSQGLGEEGGLNDGQFGGIGNTRTAVLDSNIVNIYNPSSYSYLAKGQPLFGIGLSSRFSQFTSNGLKSSGNIIGLTQLSMVLPLNKRFGMAFGLQPFSRKGYEFQQKLNVNGDSATHTYIGFGSTNQVFGGLSYKIIASERHDFAIGANLAYVFGSVTNERRATFESTGNAGGVSLTSYRVKSIYYNVGLNYRVKLDADGRNQLTLAAVLIPEQQFQTNRDYELYYGSDVSNRNSYDTISLTLDDSGTIRYPQTTSFGFNYSFQPSNVDGKLKTVYQLGVYADYTSTKWSRYDANFNSIHETTAFLDASRFNLGFQFAPAFDYVSKSAGIPISKRLRYRIGGYSGTLPNVENGAQLKERALTMGIGIPISSQKTNSAFNFSVQYGTRGTGQESALNERFLSVNFGVVLAPSSYEKWFKKYKLD